MRSPHLFKGKKDKTGRQLLMLTYKGETKPFVQWCAIYKIREQTLYSRIARGWPPKNWFDSLKNSASKFPDKRAYIKHQETIRKAIARVLQFKQNRLDHFEAVHFAIDKVLEMRASRAKNGRNTYGVAA